MESGECKNGKSSPEETEVMNVGSFDELYEVILRIGGVQGSQKFYTPEELHKIIERVRHGHRTSDYVTNTFRLREKVLELLPKDPVFIKYHKGKNVS